MQKKKVLLVACGILWVCE